MHPVDMVFFWAKANPERPAIIQPDMMVTYREFAEAIEAVTERIQGFALDKQEPVAVSIDHPIRQLSVCYALARSGYTVAVAARGMLAFMRAHGIQNLIYAGEGQVLSGGRNLQFHDSWLRRESKTPLKWEPAGSNAARSPLIFFTSGTTGMPKKMIVPGDAILEWVPALPIIGNASAERLLVIPNLSSGFGYNHTALLFFAGKTACFARGPEAQLALINAFKVDQFLASPQQALELVQAVEKGATYQLDSLEIARIGGSVMSKDFVQRVQTCLCRNVVSQYGATETGVIAFASWDVISDAPNAVGFVVPTVPVEIVDDNDKLLPRGEVGRVRFRSGYFAKIQAANNPDRAATSSEPWWYPGDLGRLTNDGVLCIEGRADDVINCGGVKFAGVELDEAVLAYPGVKDAGVCAARGESGIGEIWVGVEGEAEIDTSGLKPWLEAKQRPVIVGKVFVVDKVPRNAHGRLQRHLLKELLVKMDQAPGQQT